MRATQLGLRTAVVEAKYWGGLCLNVGCIPSKALLRNAELAHNITKGADLFGIRSESPIGSTSAWRSIAPARADAGTDVGSQRTRSPGTSMPTRRSGKPSTALSVR